MLPLYCNFTMVEVARCELLITNLLNNFSPIVFYFQIEIKYRKINVEDLF